VYIHTQTHTSFTVCRHWLCNSNKTIGTAVNATCQGRLPAYQFEHACHRFIKENADASVATSKETGLQVNADKTMYMVMSRDQNAGQVTV